MGEGMVVVVNGERVQMEVEAEDHPPCISAMHVTDDGELWVLSCNSGHEQPPGIMQTYDVFDKEGHFIRQVSVASPDDASEDRLFLLDGESAVCVKNLTQAARSHVAARSGQDDEATSGPLEVIYYSVAG
ncbi:MAG: hypothetical protein GF355_06980 [Candidatus Eisenbacteria bacterium]|nr:hypothetical protein [Candidatus Eisenbacteria bacterium]